MDQELLDQELQQEQQQTPLDVNNNLYDYLSSPKLPQPHVPVQITFYGEFVDSTNEYLEDTFLNLIKGASIVKSDKMPRKEEEVTGPEEKKRKRGEKIKKPLKTYTQIHTADEIVIGDRKYTFSKGEPPNVSEVGYMMNDREKFVRFIEGYMRKLHGEEIEQDRDVDCSDFDRLAGAEFSLLTHQKIVKDYMNIHTPYRGLLLFHGLGSGKTCTSIAIAEAMKSSKRIIVMVPASLLKSYKNELKKCGDIMYRKDKRWDWISINNQENKEQLILSLSSVLGIDKDYIKKQKGAFLMDVTAPSGGALTEPQEKLLSKQIDLMIDNKYTFISYNGLRKDGYMNIPRPEGQKNLFDNSVVIIDEGHNLISRIINKLEKNTEFEEAEVRLNPKDAKLAATKSKELAGEISKYFASSYNESMNKAFESTLIAAKKNSTFNLISLEEIEQLFTDNGERVIERLKNNPGTISKKEISLSVMVYQDLMRATNARVVVLSGTPIINKSNEMGVLFNILRGYIVTHEFQIEGEVNDTFMKSFNKHASGLLDYVEFDSNRLTVTFNPSGFLRNKISVGNELNVKYNGKVYTTEEQVIILRNILETKCKVRVGTHRTKNNKALPDSKEAFDTLYLDARGKLKDPKNLQRRILGLTSYFRSAQENLLPTIKAFKIIKVSMSALQNEEYNLKLEAEKNDAIGSDTYKMFTRLICNYAVRGRPYPVIENQRSNVVEDDNALIRAVFKRRQQRGDLDDVVEENAEIDELMQEVGNKTNREAYHKAMMDKIDEMKANSQQYFSLESLKVHSPKFRAIIRNIQNEENIGLNLVYSQFRSFEGLTLFSLSLDANGFTQFKLVLEDSNWVIHGDCLTDENIRKPKYGMYGEDGDVEKRDTLRSIYNGDWGNLNQTLRTQLETMFKANIRMSLVEDSSAPVEPNNNFGEIMKILTITSSGSEGINLRNTRYVHIMEPYWHPVRTEQVVGRARRICSHKDLPLEYRTVEVFIYITKFSKAQLDKITKPEDQKTTDEYLYELCKKKEETNNELKKAMKESSFDCNLYTHDAGENINCLAFNEGSSHYSYNPNYTNKVDENLDRQRVEKDFIVADINGQVFLLTIDADGKFTAYDKALADSGVKGDPLFRVKQKNGKYEREN
jgi:hypothetical protein